MENEASPACNDTSEIALKLGNCLAWSHGSVARVNPSYIMIFIPPPEKGFRSTFLLIS
jgi:hypothetical protein